MCLIASLIYFLGADHIVIARGCPAGADGNLQCCIIPRVSSFHSNNEQANLRYFKSAYDPELPSPLPQGSILEQEGGSANTLNGLDQYLENAQVLEGDYGSNLNSHAQPVTENNLISYYGASAAWPGLWT